MNPLVDDLNAVLEPVKLPSSQDPCGIECLWKFSEGFAALLANAESAAGVWIEVGPHPTTLPMMKACPTLPKDVRLLPSLRKNQEPWNTLTASLATLYAEKSDVAWRNVYRHLGNVGCVDLPSYPFTNVKYWVKFEESKPVVQAAAPSLAQQPVDSIDQFSLLRSWVQRPSATNGHVAIVEVPISALAKLISGHQV
ncbi:hypothetical protein MPER_02962, partial [Moniliophthora perniciosa FA553]